MLSQKRTHAVALLRSIALLEKRITKPADKVRIATHQRFVLEEIGLKFWQSNFGRAICIEIAMRIGMVADTVPSMVPGGSQLLSCVAVHAHTTDKKRRFDLSLIERF